MKLNTIYKLIFSLIVLSSFSVSQKPGISDDLKLINLQDQFEAGSEIILRFKGSSDARPPLYCSNSYGSIIVDPKVIDDQLFYEMPQFISDKVGMVNWEIISETNSLTGMFHIDPKEQVAEMETYLGPPSIQAGKDDYTMIVVIPTDIHDNPLKDSTEVIIKHQFLAAEKQDKVLTNNLISYKNLYSENESGRMLISSESAGVNSKEYNVNIWPSVPTDFTISYHRNHSYADGNQIVTFSSSEIKDIYGNTISDGTYVNFYITNSSNVILKTSGTTIKGIAKAKMIHPDHPEQWNIKAYIQGMAESNDISIEFDPAISDFNVNFSEDNRTITVGPLQSFMNQLVPDGLEIKVAVISKGKSTSTIIKNSFEGFASIKLHDDSFPDGPYEFKIEVAGISKTFENKKLW